MQHFRVLLELIRSGGLCIGTAQILEVRVVVVTTSVFGSKRKRAGLLLGGFFRPVLVFVSLALPFFLKSLVSTTFRGVKMVFFFGS